MRVLPFTPGKIDIQRLFILAILVIPLMILMPGWSGFAYSPRSLFSDISISHYPNAVYLLRSLQEGQFPLWSSSILSGYPFGANPLSGEWYLPGWFAYLFPLPFGFNVTSLLHLWFSGIGMWLFLRASGRSPVSALCGAIAWELFPKIFAHFGAGHLTFVYAVSWTPWLLLAQLRQQQVGTGRIKRCLPGVILGLIALADLRWAAIAGMLWTAYAVSTFLQNHDREPGGLSAAPNLSWGRRAWEKTSGWILNIVAALMVAAPQLIPLVEYTNLSTRAHLDLVDNLTYSLQPVHLFGLLVPAFQGMAEWVIYPGCTLLFPIAWGLARARLRRANLFWLVWLLFCLIFSMGASFPFLSFIYQLPGLNLLRVPTRMMVGLLFAVAVIFSSVVDELNSKEDEGKHFWGNLFLFGLCVFPWIIAIGLWGINQEFPLPYAWAAIFISICAGMVIARRREWISQFIYRAAMIAILVLDLGTVSWSQFTYRSAPEVTAANAEIARWLANQPGYFRVYSPSYSLPQQTAALWGISLADGVDPLQLASYVQYMASASGVPNTGYSVTLPPFKNGEPETSNRGYLPAADELGLLNVRFVVSDFPFETPGLSLVKMAGSSYVYENQLSLPRAWIQAETETIGQNAHPVSIGALRPNSIDLKAAGPGLLVISEINYPGWHVFVDGKELSMESPLGILRGVVLSAGDHEVAFRFQPLSVYCGILIAALVWGWLALWTMNDFRKSLK